MNKSTNEKKWKRLETFKRLINLGLTFVCLGLETLIFTHHWLNDFQYSVVEELRNFWFKGHLLEVAIYAAILFAFSTMYGGMRLGYLRNVELIFSQVFATLIANLLIYAELSVMAFQLFTPEVFLTMMFEQTVVVIVYISVANYVYRRIFPPRRVLVVGGYRPVDALCAKLSNRKDKYVVAGVINIQDGYEKVCETILKAYKDGTCSAVLLGDISLEERGELFKFCYGHSIRVYVLPKITDVIMMGAEELHIFDTPLLLTREYSLAMEQRFIKRAIDLIGSLLLIVLSSPIMILTAIIIKLYDGGPILYKQVRCTIDRREFHIMKFRSMRTDAEKDGVARLASKNDSRITPIGKVIRKCRVDELPQLFNILKGDMSFIGPRPERPEIIAQYMEVMPEFAFRMKVKAGLAGFAQVYGKYNTTPYDKLKLDLTYIENYSVWLDLKLMLLTLKILFWPDSTEGVENEQITALKEERGEKASK